MFGSALVTLTVTTYAKRLLARVHVEDSGAGAAPAEPVGRRKGEEANQPEPAARRQLAPRGREATSEEVIGPRMPIPQSEPLTYPSTDGATPHLDVSQPNAWRGSGATSTRQDKWLDQDCH
jgi:hypothetical protein